MGMARLSGSADAASLDALRDPAANALNRATTHCARRPVAAEHRRKTVPSASHGTFTTAPSRKNTRTFPWSHPVDVPVASAADASAKNARESAHARYSGRREQKH